MRRREFITLLGGAITACPLRTALAAGYKPEFKMSIVGPNEDTPWGRAATRFADAIKYRTQGRIQIKNYFNGQLFAGKQTTEFAHLQQGLADFSIGSTINWSPQVKQLNIFALPFMFPSYAAVDAVEGGEPGERLFKLIERNGAIPIAWGENGYRSRQRSRTTSVQYTIHRRKRQAQCRFSNWPVWVKRFQTIHCCSVDVARGLVLLSGIAPGPFHHGVRERGGPIYWAALPSD